MSFHPADGTLTRRLIQVTDGASEAGMATARLLATAGARVVLSYTGDPEATRAAADRLRAEGLDVSCAEPGQAGAERPELLVGTAAIGADAAGGPAVRQPETGSEQDVVVVGMGLAVPGASSPEQFWQLLRSGEPMFSEPGARLDLTHLWSADPTAQDRTYTRTAGFMHDFVPHPALAAELAGGAFDTQEYTAIWLRHALLQATDGIAIGAADRQLFAVGLTPDGSQHLEQSLVTRAVRHLLSEAGHPVPAGLAQRYPLGAADPEDVLPYRIARAAVAGLAGDPEIVVVDTACSSSLYSIDIGVRALRAGDADVALCGGAFALTAQNLVLFGKLRGLSRSGSVRSLDAGADGVLFSDSAAVLALKTHARAVADGDPILGFVAGFGGSSDGRGKAIYAPNATGQKIALQRAWSAAGTGPDGPDWVVAHATGTPAGDRTEMVALAETAPGKTWTMTSSKSLIGHSGWAAGVVSVIHALLAMRYETIPGQRVFTELPSSTPASIRVPTADTDWAAEPGRTRRVGVSAMGFGGTNGHLVLTDRAPQRAVPATEPAAGPEVGGDEVVVVGTGWHLPGNPDEQQVAQWLAGGRPSWPESFGDDYPLPSPVELRLAPSAIAAMDRSQLIALKCVDQLVGSWHADPELAARTGVLVGHTGPTRSAFGYDLRCVLTELSETVLKPAGIPPEVIADPVQAMVRPTNEDSYPGLMPNIIPARLVQRLDLHGLNMTLDAGRDSVNSALANAVRYLRDGELDVALVLGVNATVDFLRPWRGRRPAEAAIGFVLTRASIASRLELPVLGRLAVEPAGGAAAVGGAAPVPSPPGDRDHRGAEGAVSLLAALRGQPGQVVRIATLEDGGTPAILVTPGPAVTANALPAVPPGAGINGIEELARDFGRHHLVLRPRAAGRSEAPPLAALVPDSLLIIDEPRALAGVVLPPGCLIIAPRPDAGVPPAEGVHYLDDAAELAGVLAADGRPFDQLRVVLSSGWSPAALKVHDLVFAAAQSRAQMLADGGCLAMLLLDSVTGAPEPVPVPLAGLFGGLARSLSRELPGARVLVTATDTVSPADGLAQLGAELAGSRLLPVAYYAAGRRYEQLLVPVAPAEPGTDPRLPVAPVLLATGGARGLTAHLVTELASASRPSSIWLLGSSPAPADAIDHELPGKPEMVRRLMAEHPGEKLADITRRYERAVQDAERARTMAALRQLTGPGGVHYLQCDVRDPAAVAEAVRTVLERHGRIDIVVHGAGLSRSASLDRKRLDDFRMVRDVKVLGDLNLRTALQAGGQRPALWCSVSSVSAIIGMRGEFDYCAGNEYLMLAAGYARAVQGRDELALTSGLWLESGMAAANTPGGAFLARQAEIGQLSDAQGRQFFGAELLGRPGPGAGGPLATTWLSALDWASLHARAPGLQQAGLEAVEAPPRRWAFLDPASRTGSATWSCLIELDRHRYLRDHLVEDRPALPGTFILELGMEAAAAVSPPGVRPVALTDVVLSRFIRAAEHRWPRTVLVSAELAGDTVRVRVCSPASELVPEREHTRMTVRLGDSLPPAPVITLPAGNGWPAPNTYQLPGTPVRLTGIFDALREPRFESDGGSALLRLSVTDRDGPFQHFLLPSLTLDCLLRTAVLDGGRPERVAAMVPTELASVQLFSTANDLELAARWPEGLLLRHWRDRASGLSRCAAIAPDGQVLVLVEGIGGSEQAVFDVRAGGWRRPAADDGSRQQRTPVSAGST